MLKELRALWSLIRGVITILLVVLLAVIIVQRVTNNTKAVAGFRIFTVVTESMVPKYKIGDAILTRSVNPAELKIGDDITYMGKEDSFKDKIVTHRIIKMEKNEDGTYTFQTKGIANDVADPKIHQSQVYGKVIYKIQSISYLNGIMGNLYGMYFVIFVPFALIMFIEFIANRRDRDREEDDEEDEDDNEDKKDNEKEEDDDAESDRIKERRKKRREKRRERRREKE